MSQQTDFKALVAFAAESLNGHNRPWLDTLRQDGLARFDALGLPTSRNEEWKYTSTRGIRDGAFAIRHDGPCDPPEGIDDLRPENAIELVYIDGLFQPGLTSGPVAQAGLRITPFSEAVESRAEALEKALTFYDTESLDAFTGLNTAYLGQGLLIEVDSNAVIEPIIHVMHLSTDESDGLIQAPRTILTAGKHAEACLLETWYGRHDTCYFSNTVTDLFVEEGGNVSYCKIQNESNKAYHVGTTRIQQEANSQVHTFTLDTGAQMARHNTNFSLNGEGCDNTLDGLYILRNEQHVDHHTSVDHRFPHCESSQLYKGLLDDSSRGVFNGKIFVRQPAQKTNAYQLNQNLLLSPNAHIDTKPQLEIYADDVRCTHGATIGQLEEEEIFYLRSRCISEEDAIKLLARGYCQDVVYRVKHPALEAFLHQQVRSYFCLKRLDA